MSEQVIKRDEYKVGMTVRLRNGDTNKIKRDTGGGDGDCPLIDDAVENSWNRDGRWAIGDCPEDIIGEVVANTAAPEVATNCVTITTETQMTQGQCDDNAMHLFLIIDGAVNSPDYDDIDRAQALELLAARFKCYGLEV